jgi:choline dehydrogenase-like flavoprotein
MSKITVSSGPEGREWDVIVVGTGMGGAVFGYSLARSGKSVLFCEKGRLHLNDKESLKGDYAEEFLSRSEPPRLQRSEALVRAGRYSDEIEDTSFGKKYRFTPFIGSGTGGSSALYGMALERFHPADFEAGRFYQDAQDSTIPRTWPITYQELRPYYETAERLFRVRGTPDPLIGDVSMSRLVPPPPLSPGGQELHDFLVRRGFHPYRLPLACEYVSGCGCCQSYLCDKDCKNDSARICLEPALSQYGADLLHECDVVRLEATRERVTEVVCIYKGKQISLRGNIVVLAAGALATPGILLNSASSVWPKGLANESGLVGKNLMRHFIDLYALLPKSSRKGSHKFKEIAFNDYYLQGERKLGTVQSFGAMPPPSVLAEGMGHELERGSMPFTGPLFRLARPLIKTLLSRIFSGRLVLASILEDLPYRDNRVMLADEADTSGKRRLVIRYQIKDHDRLRIDAFRRLIAQTLSPYSFMLIKQAENNERIAHACGTCRFGPDPKVSVLDRNNRAHSLSNLYIVDASFFPSSGGTNPALTIAANALRVADHLVSLGD